MASRGLIQNEECIGLTLYEGREFIIPCEGSKDANSKRVSLYNARRRLSIPDQKKIKIQKELLGDSWIVRICPNKQSILEVIDGKLVEYTEEIEVSKEIRGQIVEMLQNDYSETDIVNALSTRGLNEKTILEEVRKVAL